MARRGYPAEFRRRVLDLIEGGRRVSEVAAELEISQQTIYTWRHQRRESTPASKPVSRPPNRPSSRLRSEGFESSRPSWQSIDGQPSC